MRRMWTGLLVVVALTGTALAQPAEVIIIRHAEKPAEGKELSRQGRERAAALRPISSRRPTCSNSKRRLRSMPRCRPSKNLPSARPETVAPLASVLRSDDQRIVSQRSSCRIGERDSLQSALRRQNGAHLLGPQDDSGDRQGAGREDAPAKWHGEVFDRTWVIKFPARRQPDIQEPAAKADVRRFAEVNAARADRRLATGTGVKEWDRHLASTIFSGAPFDRAQGASPHSFTATTPSPPAPRLRWTGDFPILPRFQRFEGVLIERLVAGSKE